MANKVTNDYSPRYGNAIATSAVGGAAWGSGLYLFNKKPFMDKAGNISDAFVKKLEDSLVAVKDKATLDNINFQKNLEKSIDEIVNIEKLKEFVNKNKDDFMRLSENDITILNGELGKMDFAKAKEMLKGLFEKDGKYTKYYKETIASCYDDAGKKLVHDAQKIAKEKFDIIKKVISKERAVSALKSAGTCTALCAIMCCLAEFFMSRKANKNKN